MKTIIDFTNGVLVLILVLSFYSCHDTQILPQEPAGYFPLEDNAQATYLKEYISPADGSIWWTDTVTLKVSGDTLIDGLAYKKIVNEHGSLEKVVRGDGQNYWGRNHEFYGGFSKEYLFLDTTLPVNGSWEHVKNDGQTKTEYIVKEVHSTQVVNGVEYSDVIVLEVNYYDNYDDGINFALRYSAKHYYANGIGEIYGYYPYSASGMFSNLSISILPPSK